MNTKHRLSLLGLAFAILCVSFVCGQEAPPPVPPPTPAAETPPVATPPPAEPNPAALVVQQAKDAYKKGAWQDALEAALKALQLQPKDFDGLYIAGVSERQLNRLADAEGHLKSLTEASPKYQLSHFQLGYVLFLQAEGLTRAGQVDPAKAKYLESAEEFGKELSGTPTHAPSLQSRAIAFAQAGRLDDSVQAHEAWIAAVPQNKPVVSLAATYAGAGRGTDAMSALDRLPDKSPKAVFDGMLATAAVFSARRDWSGAVPFLEKAASTDETSSKARALLTEATARAGSANDAARNLQTLLTLDPTPEEADSVGDAIRATIGDGTKTVTPVGVEPPRVIRVPSPRYPKGQDDSVQTQVDVLALVRPDATVGNTVLVPNRIWKDIRKTGFEAAAFDAVKRGKFAAGTKDGQPAELWVVIAVKFARL